MAKNNKEFRLEVPGGENVVLLHTCCAPCSSAIIECMMKNGITPVIYYCNPNIYPREEYEIHKGQGVFIPYLIALQKDLEQRED